MSALNGGCVTKALGTVTLTHPVEGACALILLLPPVLKPHFQNYPGKLCQRVTALHGCRGLVPSPFPHVKDSS